jgi:hypothetical protein
MKNGTEAPAPVVDTIPSARLKKCFRSGDVVGMFPLLRTWFKEELRALLKDVELFHKVSLEKLLRKADEWIKNLGKSKTDNTIRAAVKHAHDTLAFRLMVVCSEINSVALYYLEGKR